MKFTPTQSNFPDDFAGFWKPKDEGGEVVKGQLVDEFDGEFGKTLIVKLSAKCVVEQKDGDKLVDYTAGPGESIGINMKAGLRGLDKYVGHNVTIKHLGKVTERKGNRSISKHQFDVDLSDKPVESKSGKTRDSKSAESGA